MPLLRPNRKQNRAPHQDYENPDRETARNRAVDRRLREVRTKEVIVKILISASVALTLLGSTAALAQRDVRGGQDNYGQNSQSQNRQGQNSDPRQNNGGRFDPEGFNESHNDRPHWSRGDRLPEQYRQNQYVIGDWQRHNLRTPPRGYHWVRNDNDQYLLAAIATGIIFDIVNDYQYRDDYQWSRGDRLSGRYLDNRYVVSDWRANHLRQPPRGYHWVRINNQTMLTSQGRGLIAEIIVNGR
jgi:Ni/Co efflux regulator RcnB